MEQMATKQNIKNMKNEFPSKQRKSAMNNPTERRKAKEAKSRRKVNEDWRRVEKTGKYRKAVACSARKSTTNKIAMEVLDGIFLNLNPRNNDKSPSEQKKILRRIVEKRQAQALFNKTRKSSDRRTAIAVKNNTSHCIEHLQRIRFAS